MSRETDQKILDMLMPGLELPAPRTEEEFILATQPINPELEELETQIRSETIIAMYLMDQLNAKKKAIHELYEKERALKSEIVERSRKRK
jgi:hypothetical protein